MSPREPCVVVLEERRRLRSVAAGDRGASDRQVWSTQLRRGAGSPRAAAQLIVAVGGAPVRRAAADDRRSVGPVALTDTRGVPV
jgi:hypothetical protein